MDADAVYTVAKGFRRLLSEEDSQELIKKWARYSRGLEEDPLAKSEASSLRKLVDVVYRHRPTDAEYFGLPHDTRRLIPNYIEEGDRVFVWGHGDSKIMCLRHVLKISSVEWLRGQHQNWNSAMSESLGQVRVVVRVRSKSAFVGLRDEAGRSDEFSYHKANLALPYEVHLKRLENAEIAEEWERRTKELHLNREFSHHNSTGYRA